MEQRDNEIRMMNIKIAEIKRCILEAKRKKKYDAQQKQREEHELYLQQQMRQNFNSFKTQQMNYPKPRKRKVKRMPVEIVEEEPNSDDEVKFFEYHTNDHRFVRRDSNAVDQVTGVIAENGSKISGLSK